MNIKDGDNVIAAIRDSGAFNGFIRQCDECFFLFHNNIGYSGSMPSDRNLMGWRFSWKFDIDEYGRYSEGVKILEIIELRFHKTISWNSIKRLKV